MNSDNKPLSIVLLRHGETVYNEQKRLQSGKDSLNEKGKKQIEDVTKELIKFNFDKIISSDEKRAIESSEIISKTIGKNFEQTPLIREKSSGDFSDKLVNEVDWSTIKGTFLGKKIPNGESVQELMVRATDFFKGINKFKQGETILIVSHGTFLRVLIGIIFNQDIEDLLLNQEFPNASYLIIERNEKGKWYLSKSSLVRKK